jgi:ribosomal protein S18 acetylase RimI-like enzyme
MSILIRNYTPQDREFILTLVPRFSEFPLPEWRSRAEIDTANREILGKALDTPEVGSQIWVAEDENGTPAGFVHLQTQTDYFTGEKHGYISDLAVAATFEGHGVGRTLLDAAEAWARKQNFRLLTLYVFAGNDHARRIYEKRGFAPEVVKYVKKMGGGSD